MNKYLLKTAAFIFAELVFCQTYAYDNKQLDDYIKETMVKGDIPGLTLVIVDKEKEYIKSYGYADLKSGKAVTDSTLFELGSCSKAFTAITVLKLISEYQLDPDDDIVKYLPWFAAFYNNVKVKITINDLLHHTSGIPWHSIDYIYKKSPEASIENIVKDLDRINLIHFPGSKYEYATINYDILALIIEKISGVSYNRYLRTILDSLDLHNTFIGDDFQNSIKSNGYKISFFKPRYYDAPIYSGNIPAAYILSNGLDMIKWLQIQLGSGPDNYKELIQKSHEPNTKVAPQQGSYYCMGWASSLSESGYFIHEGLNPNFSTFISFNKDQKQGVVLLANSNSSMTTILGENVYRIINDRDIVDDYQKVKDFDKFSSIILATLLGFIFVILTYLFYVIYGVVTKTREFNKIQTRDIFYCFILVLLLLPMLYGISILPKALLNFSWNSLLIWAPSNILVSLKLLLSAVLAIFILHIFTLFFPEKNRFKKDIPGILLISIVSGLSNMLVILIITTSLGKKIELKYLLFFFTYSFLIYIIGRRQVQIKLTLFTRDLIYNIRMDLIKRIFSTNYQNFEKLDSGRILSTINDDIGVIGNSATSFIGLITNIITIFIAFFYLSILSFWATLIVVLLIGTISTIYYFVSRGTKPLFEEARNTRDSLLTLLEGMINGYKELSIHKNKKVEYKNDIDQTAYEYKIKISNAQINFTNASIVGESFIIIVLASLAFIVPILFPSLSIYEIMGFIIIILYLIGPINGILGSVPMFMQFKIAWNRIQNFLAEIPDIHKLNDEIVPINNFNKVENIKLNNIKFAYSTNGENKFSVGPISFEVKSGEALFIIGGNGSGKSTLAKLLTGLYNPDSGEIEINNQRINGNIGEYYSAVFSPFVLFKKIYNVDVKSKIEETEKFLKILRMDKKVKIIDKEFNTVNLSNGQRKRLALLQCYLEDKPIFLFDEWAADQDPTYRSFFYQELIPAMKKSGKIVIAITHDDHYFDQADSIIKLEMGKMKIIKNSAINTMII